MKGDMKFPQFKWLNLQPRCKSNFMHWHTPNAERKETGNDQLENEASWAW